jgi:DNA-binding MarR family transcriptional regulator
VKRPRHGDDVARDVWATMRNLVIDNERKREVCDVTGLSFGKTRALRRIAHHAVSMGELAALLGMDPPNVTTLVDDLQLAGLVERQPHPTDRRVMLVVATAEGERVARMADDILDQPPHAIVDLPITDLEELRRILLRVE